MANDTEYEVLVGINFVPDGKSKEVRLEPGKRVKRSELPRKANVKALVEQGALAARGAE